MKFILKYFEGKFTVKYTKFEVIEVWRFSRKLAADIYSATNCTDFNKDCVLQDKIRNSAASVVSNIAESFENYAQVDSVNYLEKARASATELKTQLNLAFNLNYLNEFKYFIFLDQILIIIKSLSGLIKYLSNSFIYN